METLALTDPKVQDRIKGTLIEDCRTEQFSETPEHPVTCMGIKELRRQHPAFPKPHTLYALRKGTRIDCENHRHPLCALLTEERKEFISGDSVDAVGVVPAEFAHYSRVQQPRLYSKEMEAHPLCAFCAAMIKEAMDEVAAEAELA